MSVASATWLAGELGTGSAQTWTLAIVSVAAAAATKLIAPMHRNRAVSEAGGAEADQAEQRVAAAELQTSLEVFEAVACTLPIGCRHLWPREQACLDTG